jgi:hypothetical protein
MTVEVRIEKHKPYPYQKCLHPGCTASPTRRVRVIQTYGSGKSKVLLLQRCPEHAKHGRLGVG